MTREELATMIDQELLRRYLIDLLDDDEIATMTDVLQRVLEGLDPQRD